MTKEMPCIYCGKPIKWLRIRGGARVPCDAEPIGYISGNGGSDAIISQIGERVTGTILDWPRKGAPIGYRPHGSVCDASRRALARREGKNKRGRREKAPLPTTKGTTVETQADGHEQLSLFSMAAGAAGALDALYTVTV